MPFKFKVNIVLLICGIAIATLVSLTDASSSLRDTGAKPLKEMEEYEKKPWWAGHHKYYSPPTTSAPTLAPTSLVLFEPGNMR